VSRGRCESKGKWAAKLKSCANDKLKCFNCYMMSYFKMDCHEVRGNDVLMQVASEKNYEDAEAAVVKSQVMDFGSSFNNKLRL